MTPQEKRFRIAASLSIGIIIFLILVGGIVRSTGSGMGCPDWPKCFGYSIPPTAQSQIEFVPNKHFKKGAMIIYEEALWKAKADFTTGESFDVNNWEKYTKHNYAIFNATHTWTEFLNRLVGVLTGFFIIGMFITSLPYWKTQKMIVFLSFLGVILVGFEGWLGKLVVDSNLHEGMITIHMVVAMLLLMVLIVARMWAFAVPKASFEIPKAWIGIGILLSILILVQIVLGTQVRENVDSVARSLGEAQRENWISKLGSIYSYHTSFYFVIILALFYWINQLRNIFPQESTVKNYSYLLIGLLFSEILFGMIMNKFAIPAILQPLHLLFATLLFVSSFVITARLWRIR